MQVLRRRFGQLLHSLLDAPLPVLQRQIHHVGFPGGDAPYRLALADLETEPEDHPALPILESPAMTASPSARMPSMSILGCASGFVVQRLRVNQLNLVHVFSPSFFLAGKFVLWFAPSFRYGFCMPARDLRGVAVLALSRSSHGHICFGDGYSVICWCITSFSGEGIGCF